MKAAVLTEFGHPLEVRELPDPTPGPNDAVVRVEACGICRSDWHVWQGDWTWIGIGLNLPLVLGHEIGGVIEAVGSDVDGFRPGERVTVPFHMACGRCQYCYSGRSNLCLAHGAIGFHFDGGFGRLARVPDAEVNLVRLPDEVDFLSAAALGCRYMTAYHGVVDRAEVRPGEWLAVFGVGGVGLSAVQIASTLGAQVVVVDITEEKLERARVEGAVAAINASKENAVEAIKEVTQGGADVALDALGSAQTALPAILSLRKGGRHLQIGLASRGQGDMGMLSLPVDAMVFQEITFLGSFGCPTTGYPGLLALVAGGKLEPTRLVSSTVSVEQAGEVLSSMTEFATVGLNVITAW
jgi:propanol-preferring alcohol dehydrogenase